ncbi:MAG: hypothetical protein QXN05_00570 [Acidilobaceae archaeon]
MRVWKLIAAFLALLTVVSAVTGIWVYMEHISPARKLAEVKDYSDLLSRVSEIVYTLSYDNEELRVHVVCEGDCRKGTIEVYDVNGTPRYSIVFEYRDKIFLAKMVYANGTSIVLDPIKYADGLAGGIVFERDANGTVVEVEIFPGLVPLLLPYHLGLKRGTDWNSIAKLRDGLTLTTPSFLKTEVEGKSYRGLGLSFEGYGVYLANHEWFAPSFDIVLVSVEDVPVASSIRALVPKPGFRETIEVQITLESLKRAS